MQHTAVPAQGSVSRKVDDTQLEQLRQGKLYRETIYTRSTSTAVALMALRKKEARYLKAEQLNNSAKRKCLPAVTAPGAAVGVLVVGAAA
jgi:hypothetical protein